MHGDEHRVTIRRLGNLGDLLTHLGGADEAEPLLSEAVGTARRTLPGQDLTGATMRKLGRCLTALGRFEEAERELPEAHRVLEAAVGVSHGQTRKIAADLVALGAVRRVEQTGPRGSVAPAVVNRTLSARSSGPGG